MNDRPNNPGDYLRAMRNAHNRQPSTFTPSPEGEVAERTYVDQKVDVIFGIMIGNSLNSREAIVTVKDKIRDVVTSIVDDLY